VPTFVRGASTYAMGSSHNDYVDLLVRGGLLYSIAFWSFVAFVVVRALRQQCSLPPLLAYLSFGMVGTLFAALYQNIFKDGVFAALFWAYVAGVSYYTHRQRASGLPPGAL
jgi:CHASE2 domain-containing sensor protein